MTDTARPNSLKIGLWCNWIFVALTAIGWWVLSQRNDRAYQEGVAAYGRGARAAGGRPDPHRTGPYRDHRDRKSVV